MFTISLRDSYYFLSQLTGSDLFLGKIPVGASHQQIKSSLLKKLGITPSVGYHHPDGGIGTPGLPGIQGLK
jgi:hypothetical protein